MYKTSNFEKLLTDMVSQAPKTFTARGKQVAHFTMMCKWKNVMTEKFKTNPDGTFQKNLFNQNILDDQYTYRSDQELQKLKAAGKVLQPFNELRALLHKYIMIRGKFVECRIYNNHKPQINSLIFHETAEGIICNTIELELKELEQ